MVSPVQEVLGPRKDLVSGEGASESQVRQLVPRKAPESPSPAGGRTQMTAWRDSGQCPSVLTEQPPGVPGGQCHRCSPQGRPHKEKTGPREPHPSACLRRPSFCTLPPTPDSPRAECLLQSIKQRCEFPSWEQCICEPVSGLAT